MLSLYQWLEKKSSEFSQRIYLIDETRELTYQDFFKKVRQLMTYFLQFPQQNKIVFVGSSSIESYELYFAITSLNLIWCPIPYLVEKGTYNALLETLAPTLIIYDEFGLALNQPAPQCHSIISINDIFAQIANAPTRPMAIPSHAAPIMSAYLTSGSTALPKVVLHDWPATLQHAISTATRYGLTANTRLYNPRQLVHVSGSFALPTIMHAGGSIIIPSASLSAKVSAELMKLKGATHVSFFPTEMREYANLIEQNPQLLDPALKRITTGGELVDLDDFIKVARAFALNKTAYDCLWFLYPYLGNGQVFSLCKTIYEYFFGRMVQVTASYGATEAICNAIATADASGPNIDWTALNSLKPSIIDEDSLELPWDGIAIGRLRLFGSSLARGYLEARDSALIGACYQTNDLASIQPNGVVTFFGRYENLIELDGVEGKINPVILERKLKKLAGIDAVIILAHRNRLHAALKLQPHASQSAIAQQLLSNTIYELITSISYWEEYPLDLGGKRDRAALIRKITQGEKETHVLSHDDFHQNFNELNLQNDAQLPLFHHG